jgi:hypothetical protein
MESPAEDFLNDRMRTVSRLPFVVTLELFELARVLVHLDHVASCIINANHRIM